MNKLLVIVNAQNDFITGPLGFDGASEIEEKILSAIDDYDAFAFIMETHDDDYLNTIEGSYLNTPHTIKGTEGHNLYGKLNNLKDKALKIIESNSFGSKELGLWLQDNFFDEIDMSGIYSHIQVMENAFIAKTYSPNSKIRIRRDLCMSNDKVYEEYAFDLMRSNHIEVK